MVLVVSSVRINHPFWNPLFQLISGRPRFGSVTVRGWNGSSGSEFWVRRFLCEKGFSVFQYIFKGKDGSGFGHPQTCVYPDVCLGIAHVSGKTPLSGQGVWQIHVSAPFALQIPWGEKGRYIVYLPDPLSRERGFTRYMAIPKHTSG